MEAFATKTYTAPYIKKNSLPPDAVKLIEQEIGLYNSMVRNALADARKGKKVSDESQHTEYKKKYKCTDYFVTNVESDYHGILKSAKKCLALRIATQEEKISQLNNKIKYMEKSLNKMLKVKKNLKARSVARKNNTKVPTFKKAFGGWITTRKAEDQTLQFVVGIPSKNKKSKPQTVYTNEYLFELNFVDPYIRNKKATIGRIKGRLHNAETLMERLEKQLKDEKFSICLGGKKLLRKKSQLDIMAKEKSKKPAKAVTLEKAKTIEKDLLLQKAAFVRKRCRPALFAGRSDAAQGNFQIRYNTKTKVLEYISTTTNRKIYIPNVVFPYGQEKVNMAIDSHKFVVKNKKLPEDQQISCWPRKPVSWTIQDCGNAFLIKCIVHEPINYVNSCYSRGCIGIDMNYDHFAVAETNDYGQLIGYQIVKFKMAERTGNQIENDISNALEKIFKYANSVGKPVAMEDIKKIKKVNLYGNRKRNRKISQFAYKTMQGLAESKANKYKLALKKVNPAYTSQTGKIKYMRQYGISIHIAAAYTIGRKAMKLKEKVPKTLRPFVSNSKENNHKAKFKDIFKGLKGVNTHCFYKNINYSNIASIKELKIALTA